VRGEYIHKVTWIDGETLLYDREIPIAIESYERSIHLILLQINVADTSMST